MTKYLMLRVGIDSGCGGALSPVNNNMEFEFIPIPEGSFGNKTEEQNGFVGYNQLINRYEGFKRIAEYIPTNNRDILTHNDPEFVTYTYGDPAPNKARALLKLNPNDYLLFYAGLKNYATEECFLAVIGFFCIEHIYYGREMFNNIIYLSNNAHIKRNPDEYGLVIVKGLQGKSRLNKHAVQITEHKQSNRPYYPICSSFSNLTGLDKDIMRSSPFWLTPPNQNGFEKWLNALT